MADKPRRMTRKRIRMETYKFERDRMAKLCERLEVDPASLVSKPLTHKPFAALRRPE